MDPDSSDFNRDRSDSMEEMSLGSLSHHSSSTFNRRSSSTKKRRDPKVQLDPPESLATISHPSFNSRLRISSPTHNDETWNRRTTQWHPQFNGHPETNPQSLPNRDVDNNIQSCPSPPNEQNNINDLLQSIVKSNENLQRAMLQQNDLLKTLLKETCETRKQLSKMSTQSDSARTDENFPSPSVTGISFDTCTLSESKKIDDMQSQQKCNDDDVSIHSSQSVVYSCHETKLNLETFDEKWLQQSAATAQIWFSTLVSELASKPYYHSLLTIDKEQINFNAPTEGPNATLHSTLQNKLSQRFRSMMLNSGITSGTSIIQFITNSLAIL